MRSRQHIDKVAADADVVIDFFNGKEPARTHLSDLIATHRLVLCAVTLFELRAGVEGKNRLQAIDKLASLAESLPLRSDAARAAAGYYTRLKKAGRLIDIGDLLVAGTCVACDVSLYTRNQRHFSRIPDLKLWAG